MNNVKLLHIKLIKKNFGPPTKSWNDAPGSQCGTDWGGPAPDLLNL